MSEPKISLPECSGAGTATSASGPGEARPRGRTLIHEARSLRCLAPAEVAHTISMRNSQGGALVIRFLLRFSRRSVWITFRNDLICLRTAQIGIAMGDPYAC